MLARASAFGPSGLESKVAISPKGSWCLLVAFWCCLGHFLKEVVQNGPKIGKFVKIQKSEHFVAIPLYLPVNAQIRQIPHILLEIYSQKWSKTNLYCFCGNLAKNEEKRIRPIVIDFDYF